MPCRKRTGNLRNARLSAGGRKLGRLQVRVLVNVRDHQNPYFGFEDFHNRHRISPIVQNFRQTGSTASVSITHP